MISKDHNHTLQINSRHGTVFSQSQNTDCHKTFGRQLKQSNQPFLPHQYHCNTRHKGLNKKQGPNIKPSQTMGAAINNKSKRTEPPLYNKQHFSGTKSSP